MEGDPEVLRVRSAWQRDSLLWPDRFEQRPSGAVVAKRETLALRAFPTLKRALRHYELDDRALLPCRDDAA